MKCYLSTSCFKNIPILSAIEECAKFDVAGIELSAPHPFEAFENITKKLNKLKEKGRNFIIHNYFPPPKADFVLNIASGNSKIKQQNNKLIEKAFLIASEIKSPYYGIHAGYLSDAVAEPDGMFVFEKNSLDYKTALENAADFINKISDRFKKNGVTLLIENLFPTGDGNKSIFCNLEEIDDLMELIPESTGILLDLGHLNISSKLLGFDKFKFLELFLNKYGNRLFEIHISENNGKIDAHLPITKESWQFDVIRTIKSVKTINGFKRIYCLESRQSNKDELEKSIDLINRALFL